MDRPGVIRPRRFVVLGRGVDIVDGSAVLCQLCMSVSKRFMRVGLSEDTALVVYSRRDAASWRRYSSSLLISSSTSREKRHRRTHFPMLTGFVSVQGPAVVGDSTMPCFREVYDKVKSMSLLRWSSLKLCWSASSSSSA